MSKQVRRDQVMLLIRLGMTESDADVDSSDFQSAKAELDRAESVSTQAEVLAAHDALRRHGY